MSTISLESWPPYKDDNTFVIGPVYLYKATVVSYSSITAILKIKFTGENGLINNGVGTLTRVPNTVTKHKTATKNVNTSAFPTQGTAEFLVYVTPLLNPGDEILICLKEGPSNSGVLSQIKNSLPTLENGQVVYKNIFAIDQVNIGIFYSPKGDLKTINKTIHNPATLSEPVIFPIPMPRMNLDEEKELRLGYADLTVAPESITITTEMQLSETPILRSRNTMKKGHGHALPNVEISLAFPTELEIEGLSQVLKQIRHTPFLPVVNKRINDAGIDALAITSISVSTTEESPGTIFAQIDGVQFDWRQYFPDDDSDLFSDLWCWPLFKLWCESSTLFKKRTFPKWDKNSNITEQTILKTPDVEKVKNLKASKSKYESFGKSSQDGAIADYVIKNLSNLESQLKTFGLTPGPKGLKDRTVIGNTKTTFSYDTFDTLYAPLDATGRRLYYLKAAWVGNSLEQKIYGVLKPHSLESVLEAMRRIQTLGTSNFGPVLLYRTNIETAPLDNHLLLQFPKFGEDHGSDFTSSETKYIEYIGSLQDSIKKFQNTNKGSDGIGDPSDYIIVAEVNDVFWKHVSTIGSQFKALTATDPLKGKPALAFPDNEEYWVTWKFDWVIESFSSGFRNYISSQQSRSEILPALQYMGGTDIQIHLAGTLFSNTEASRIDELMKTVEELALNFRGIGLGDEYTGFVRIENQLAALMGVEWVIPIEYSTQTVPGFPGDLGFSLNLVEFNPSQSERETIEDEFPAKPTRIGELEQYTESVVAKMERAKALEDSLSRMELYPDLDLPSYLQLNSFIDSLQSKDLPESVSEWNFPLFKSLFSQLKKGRKNFGYAEPDFYVISKNGTTPEINRLIEEHQISGDPNYKYTDGTGMNAYFSAGKSFISSEKVPISRPGEKPDPANVALYKKNKTLSPIGPSLQEKLAAESAGQILNGVKDLSAPNIAFDYSFANNPDVSLYGGAVGTSDSKAGYVGFTNPQQVKAARQYRLPDGITAAQARQVINELKSKMANLKFGSNEGQKPIAKLGPNGPYEKIINDAASATNIDPAYIKAVIQCESNAENLPENSARAAGLMQLVPSNAQETGLPLEDRFNPAKNVLYACKFFNQAIFNKKGRKQRFVGLSSAEYNAGQNRSNIATYDKIPETHNYSRRVFAKYVIYRSMYLSSILTKFTGAVPSDLLDAIYEMVFYGEQLIKGITPLALRLEIKGSGDYARLSTLVPSNPVIKKHSFIGPEQPTITGFSITDPRSYISSTQISSLIPTHANTTPFGENLPSDLYHPLVAGYTANQQSPTSLINPDVITPDPIKDAEPSKGAPAPSIPDNAYTATPEGFIADHIQYDQRNKLSKAFPTYCILLIDGGRWLGFYRFYDRFFGHTGVGEIEVFKTREEPPHVAQVVFSNMYGNLTSLYAEQDRIKAADIRGTLPWFGQLVENIIDPHPNDFYLQQRAAMIDSLMLRAGTRLHIRMGYGSDASTLPVAFNGTIVEVPTDEGFCKVIALGDGGELLKDIAPNNTDKFTPELEITAVAGSGKDPRNTVLEMFLKTSDSIVGNLAYRLSGGKYVHNNAYGIENFGRPFISNLSTLDTPYIPADLNNPQKNSIIPTDYIPVEPPSGDVTPDTRNIFQKGLDFLGRQGSLGTQGNSIPFAPAVLEGEIGINLYEPRADPINTGTAPSNLIGWIWSDSDVMCGISIENANPWKVIETCRKVAPDFVASVETFYLRSTLFYGKPWWNLYYDYDYDLIEKKSEELHKQNKPFYIQPQELFFYMKRKTFQQLRIISSNHNLLENKITASKEELYTAAQTTEIANLWGIGKFGRNSTLKYFDSEVYTENIRIKTGRSGVYVTSLNNLTQARDALAGVIITGNGKFQPFDTNAGGLLSISSKANENAALSEVKDGLKKMYRGEVLIHGDASYRPFNLIHIHDEQAQMAGMFEARNVLHRMSLAEGFTTTITPDLCVSTYDPFQVQWWMWAGQYASSIQIRRYSTRLASKLAIAFRESKLFGNSIDKTANFMKKLATTDETKELIDLAVKDIKEGNFLEGNRSGREIYNAIKEKLFASQAKIKDTKAFTEFAENLEKRVSTGTFARISEKFKNYYINAAQSESGVRAQSIFAKASKVYSEFAGGEDFIAVAARVARFTKIGNLIALLLMCVGVDTILEIFDRKFQARKSAVILPLRVRNKIFIAGIDGHRGGVVGDPKDLFDNALRPWLNVAMASRNFGKNVDVDSAGAALGLAQVITSSLVYAAGGQFEDEKFNPDDFGDDFTSTEFFKGAGDARILSALRLNKYIPTEGIRSTQKLDGTINVTKSNQNSRILQLSDYRLTDKLSGGRHTYGGVKPHVAQVGNLIEKQFGVKDIGGIEGRTTKSDHPNGLALDVAIGNNLDLGDQIAAWAVANAKQLSIKYVIWRQQITSNRGHRDLENRGDITANHFDHVHISFTDNPPGIDLIQTPFTKYAPPKI